MNNINISLGFRVLIIAASLLAPMQLQAKSEVGILDMTTVVKAETVKKKKQTKFGLYFTPKEAYNLITEHPEKVLFIDVRTPSELEYVGWSSLIDKNIPLMTDDLNNWDEKKSTFKKVMNPDFVSQIEEALDEKKLDSDSLVIFICRSGSRSAKAANTLANNDFTKVSTIVDGFEGDKEKEGKNKGKRVVNGWKNNGLPWGYRLNKDKLYMSAVTQ